VPATRLAFFALFTGAACGGFPGPASAQADPRSCISLADDAARLACYDRAVGRVPGARAAPATSTTSGPHGAAPTHGATAPVAPSSSGPAAGAAAATVAATPTAVTPPAPKNPVAEFGLTETAKRKKDPVKAAEAAAEPDNISGRVLSVQWRKYGEFVVTLDNGQVWEQNTPEPSAIVKVGDAVTIKKGWLGSFMLVTAGRVGTKVHRID
jgi:hypothetical protein